MKNWPRDNLDELTRYKFYGNERRQVGVTRLAVAHCSARRSGTRRTSA